MQTTQILQEFQQQLLIDIYDSDKAALEKWASLTIGIILIDTDDIIKTSNNNAKEYATQSKKMVTTHQIDHIQLTEGTPTASESPFQWQWKFKVTGSLKLSKQITQVGTIKQIHSPGKESEKQIDIDIGINNA